MNKLDFIDYLILGFAVALLVTGAFVVVVLP